MSAAPGLHTHLLSLESPTKQSRATPWVGAGHAGCVRIRVCWAGGVKQASNAQTRGGGGWHLAAGYPPPCALAQGHRCRRVAPHLCVGGARGGCRAFCLYCRRAAPLTPAACVPVQLYTQPHTVVRKPTRSRPHGCRLCHGSCVVTSCGRTVSCRSQKRTCAQTLDHIFESMTDGHTQTGLPRLTLYPTFVHCLFDLC